MRAKLAGISMELFYIAAMLLFLIPPMIFARDQEQKEAETNQGQQITTPLLPQCQSTKLMILTTVVIDGKPFCFHVDTGAQVTILNSHSLGLVPSYSGTCAITGAFGGRPAWCYYSTVKTLEVSGITAENVPVAIAPLDTWPGNRPGDLPPKVDGVLGIDFLNNYLAIIGSGDFQLVP